MMRMLRRRGLRVRSGRLHGRRLPEMIGYPVAAAVPGRYRAEPGEASGQDFWLVLPMYFTDRHITEDGTEYRDCCRLKSTACLTAAPAPNP